MLQNGCEAARLGLLRLLEPLLLEQILRRREHARAPQVEAADRLAPPLPLPPLLRFASCERRLLAVSG